MRLIQNRKILDVDQDNYACIGFDKQNSVENIPIFVHFQVFN